MGWLADLIRDWRKDDVPVASAPVSPPAQAPQVETINRPPVASGPVLANSDRVINMIDARLLKMAGARTSDAETQAWVEPIRKACRRWGIDTVREIGSFLANAIHECEGLTDLDEDLNYSARRLTQVWPNRYPTLAAAAPYANNPQALANHTYANRMGNGPPSSGDGWRFRGYGMFMLTGRRNHTAFAKDIGLTVDEALQYIRTKEGAAMSAGWFWKENNMDVVAATPGLADDRRRVQGGSLGLAEVTAVFNSVVAELLRRGA